MLAKKEIPDFQEPRKVIDLLVLAQKYLNNLTDSKVIIDLATPETTTVFLSSVIKKVKFTKP